MDPTELLTQAGELAQKENGRRTNTDLRRSISACYYALFHAICDDTATIVAPWFKTQLRSAVRRTITHLQVKKACEALHASPRTSGYSWRSFIVHPLEEELITIARTFADLQEARYLADYDSLASFSQDEVLEWHWRATRACDLWLTVRNTSNAAVFLTAVLFGDKFGKRG